MNVTAHHTPLVIHPFGTAPEVVPANFRLAKVLHGTNDEVLSRVEGEDVVLILGAALFERRGAYEVGVFAATA